MAMTMAQFLDLADPVLGTGEIRHEDEQMFEPQYPKVFNVTGLDELFRTDSKMAGFGSLVEIPEGGDVTYDEAIAPIQRRYDYVRRGLGYKITEKLWRNDRFGEVRKFEGDLDRADMDDTEVFCFNILNNATTTGITGFDGLALSSTAHTRLDGGAVQANRPTTLTAFSHAALASGIISFRKYKTDRGRPYISRPSKLVIPLDLMITADEILGSALRSDTANNTTNALRKYNLSVVETPYITSTTFWALFGDNHDINILWRYRPEKSNDVDFDSDTIKRKLVKGIARGFGEWRDSFFGNT